MQWKWGWFRVGGGVGGVIGASGSRAWGEERGWAWGDGLEWCMSVRERERGMKGDSWHLHPCQCWCSHLCAHQMRIRGNVRIKVQSWSYLRQ